MDQLTELREADARLPCPMASGVAATAAADLLRQAPAPERAPSADASGSCGNMIRGRRNRIEYLLDLVREPGNHHLEQADLLYVLLSHLLPNDAADRQSRELLDRFVTLGNLLAAPWSKLEASCGRVGGLADVLKTVHAITVGVLREPIVERPVINNTKQLHAYLKASLGHSPIEMVRILFLDTKNFLIKDELQGRGTVDHTPLYPREVLRRVIDLDAKAIILVHNHPSGDPTPSELDISMTRQLAAALWSIGVHLHDHVIVGRAGCVSFRQLELL